MPANHATFLRGPRRCSNEPSSSCIGWLEIGSDAFEPPCEHARSLNSRKRRPPTVNLPCQAKHILGSCRELVLTGGAGPSYGKAGLPMLLPSRTDSSFSRAPRVDARTSVSTPAVATKHVRGAENPLEVLRCSARYSVPRVGGIPCMRSSCSVRPHSLSRCPTCKSLDVDASYI